jgi:hypothetical protein
MANMFMLVSTKLKDSLGVTTSFQDYFLVPEATTITDLNTWLATYAADLDAVTDSQILETTYSIVGVLPGGIKAAPNAGAENERTALFNFQLTGLTYKDGVDTPSIAAAKLVDGKVDVTDTDIVAWAEFHNTTTDGIIPVNTSKVALSTWVDVLVSFRKHRKAESRRSLVVL